jgi:hypothetical protein
VRKLFAENFQLKIINSRNMSPNRQLPWLKIKFTRAELQALSKS